MSFPSLHAAVETAADMSVSIIKAPSDKKQYKTVTLPNGLTVLLIHDPDISASNATPDGGQQRPAVGQVRQR